MGKGLSVTLYFGPTFLIPLFLVLLGLGYHQGTGFVLPASPGSWRRSSTEQFVRKIVSAPVAPVRLPLDLNASVSEESTDDILGTDISSYVLFPAPTESPDQTSGADLVSPDSFDATEFGNIFRHCAPYIAQHRSSVVVIHIPGHVLQNRNVFDAISDDISIMHLLGLQLVLVVGVRDQLDTKLQQAGQQAVFFNNMRITDDEMMQHLKETSGAARFEIESSLTRGFRGRSPGQQGINVVSGNFFYSAKPLGVRDGVDFKFTGEVRRIEAENIKKRLESGDVVLLTSLGYSPSGESFNVPSESLAAECAANLKAAKIIFLTEGETLWDQTKERPVQSLRLAQAVALLDQWGIHSNTYNQVDADMSGGTPDKSSAAVNSIDNEQSPFAMENAGMVEGARRRSLSLKAQGGGEGGAMPATSSDDAKMGNFKRLVAR